MAMKEIISKRRTIEFEIKGEKVTMMLKRFEGKVRQRDPITFKNLGWGMSGMTRVTCSLYPNCNWGPYVDFGERTTDCSLEGWEMKKPEFSLIDDMATALIFEYKGWTDDEKYESVDVVLKKIEKFNKKKTKKA